MHRSIFQNFFSHIYILVLGGVVCLATLLAAPLTTYGMSTDFTTRVLVGDDTTPPSVPADVIATPVATTQIDLAWTASTDDYILSGYAIYRDDIEIASTTGTTYADTGLTEATEYTYYIVAYDSFNNRSASSSLVATTTLVTPVVATTSSSTDTRGNTTGTRVTPSFNVSLESLSIIPENDRVRITFETDMYIRGVGQWGLTSEYELGSYIEEKYAKRHTMLIDNLSPHTRYVISISGQNIHGVSGVLYTGFVTTLGTDENMAPSNVTNIRVVYDGDDVVLTWENPLDTDFDRVRVLRNDMFYPGDPYDGWLVYEGEETSARDRDIPDSETLFYTIFTYDTAGNISSGALVSYRREGNDTPEVFDTSLNPLTLSFEELVVRQEGVMIPVRGDTVTIDSTKPFTLSLPYDRFPLHLKTIMVVMRPADDPSQVFRFLLRSNEARTLYTSTVAPLAHNGTFTVEIVVFDYATQQIGYTQGRLVTTYVAENDQSSFESFVVAFQKNLTTPPVWYGLMGFLTLALIFLLRRLLYGFARPL